MAINPTGMAKLDVYGRPIFETESLPMTKNEFPAELVERCCRELYGKSWDGPEDKMPGEKMKDVWRKQAIAVLRASKHTELVAALESIARMDEDAGKSAFAETIRIAYAVLRASNFCGPLK